MMIFVKIKRVYGIDGIYPVCEQSKLFANLTNTKTLTMDAIKTIKELGYEVIVQQQKAYAL